MSFVLIGGELNLAHAPRRRGKKAEKRSLEPVAYVLRRPSARMLLRIPRSDAQQKCAWQEDTIDMSRGAAIAARGALIASLFGTSSAFADTTATEGAGVDWSRVLVEFDALARRGADVLDSPRCSRAGCQTETNVTAARPERAIRFDVEETSKAWFGIQPRLTLVARDWAGSFRVAGDRLALVDVMRLTTSTRMVLTRVRVTNARVAPFAQIGLGQWRTDPALMPHTARYEEIAAQVALGVEIRVSSAWALGVEQTGTMLHRERGDNSLPCARMWSSALASRLEF